MKKYIAVFEVEDDCNILTIDGTVDYTYEENGTNYKLSEGVEFVRVEELEQKTGEWEVYMSEEGKSRRCTCKLCGYKTGPYTWENPKYCAGCGARMINSPQNTIEDEEVKIKPAGEPWTNEEIEKGLKYPFGY